MLTSHAAAVVTERAILDCSPLDLPQTSKTWEEKCVLVRLGPNRQHEPRG